MNLSPIEVSSLSPVAQLVLERVRQGTYSVDLSSLADAMLGTFDESRPDGTRAAESKER